jgi:putative restriction endonuclease
MGRVYACFADGFEHVMANSESRQKLREALISRYFPQLSTYELKEPDVLPSSLLEEEPAVPGRSSAFRRLILDIYDHQCAACGLRIRLPTGNDITFVDAAHLIPFSESHNDHPTNGLALCKNHHWAMDRNIIAPGPDFHWHISKVIDPRRSKGEKELAQLAGQSLLLPNDPAFLPDMKGLNWRRSKMIA